MPAVFQYSLDCTSHIRQQIVTVSTCNLNQWALDFDGNLGRVRESIILAKAKGATYRVGPELELCGYGCEDHFLEPDTYRHCDESLADLLTGDLTDGILCDIGAPIEHMGARYGSRSGLPVSQYSECVPIYIASSNSSCKMHLNDYHNRFNCRILCLNGQILLIRPKSYLANDGNYRESRHFTSWKREGVVEDHCLSSILAMTTGQTVVPFGQGGISTADTFISCEVCEELWAPSSLHVDHFLAGAEIIGNG